MALHRLIYRLDFKPNFRLIDQPGRVMELLFDQDPSFWNETIQDAKQERQISVQFSDGSPVTEHRSVTVRPTSIAFNFEIVEGLNLDLLESAPFVSKSLDILQSLLDEFRIKELNRAGARFFILETIEKRTADCGTLEPVLSALKFDLVKAINDKAGNVSDVGLSFDGADDDDRAKYHVRFGPLLANEIPEKRYFDEIKNQLGKSSANIIFDVDFYEEKLSFQGRRASGWLKFQRQKMQGLIPAVTQAIYRSEP